MRAPSKVFGEPRMYKVIVAPSWGISPVTGQIQYLSYHCSKLDNMLNKGMTVREGLEFLADYFQELAAREDAPNEPEAYRILADNAKRLSRGQAPIWAVEDLGYKAVKVMNTKKISPPGDFDEFDPGLEHLIVGVEVATLGMQECLYEDPNERKRAEERKEEFRKKGFPCYDEELFFLDNTKTKE